MTLRDRLEMLTLIAKDTKQSATQRIAAMKELHRQSGDDAANVTLSDEEGQEATNIVRMVDVNLPQPKPNTAEVEEGEEVNEEGEEVDYSLLDELNKLDEFESEGLIKIESESESEE